MARALHDLLASAAKKYPNHIALIDQGSVLTYAELCSRSAVLAQELIAAGINVGTPVGLSMPKSPDAVIAVYGIMMAGACYVPIDPAAPVSRAVGIVRSSYSAFASAVPREPPIFSTRPTRLAAWLAESSAVRREVSTVR